MRFHIEIVHIVIFSNSFTNAIIYKYILVTLWSKLPNNPINFIVASLTDVAAKFSKQY